MNTTAQDASLDSITVEEGQASATSERGPAAVPVTIIQPRRGWQAIDWGELWQYRDLFYFLAWRDVKVRYKQTVLGAAWAIIQPVMNMVVFSIFFGRLAGLDQQTGGIPYPIWVYAGLLPWTFFAGALTRSAQSIVAEERLITKVYFPRLIIPAASAGSALVDLAVAFSVLIVMMFWYGQYPSLGVLLIPALVTVTVVAALGVGMLLSALNVAYRDFRYVIPFLIQLWMFATPVVYPVKIVPENWRWLLCLNPMAGLIEAYRAALLGGSFEWPNLGVSAGVGLASFLFGVYYFRRMERTFADII